MVYDFVLGNKRYERLKKQGETEQTEKPKSFKEILERNKKIISVVRSQEEDKLPVNAFTGLNLNNSYSQEEIIKDSNLVSYEEMQEKVYPAEQVLLEVKIKDINKKINQNDKKRKRKIKAKLKNRNRK